MGLLRNIVMGRPDGLRARLRRALSAAGLWLPTADPTTGDQVGQPADIEGTPAGPEDQPVPEGYAYAAPEGALADGEVMEVIVDGEPIALCRVDGQTYAVSNVCPHAGGPIGDGDIYENEVVCPWHGWSFDVRTGACAVDDSIVLPTYDVRLDNGRVLVKLVQPAVAASK